MDYDYSYGQNNSRVLTPFGQYSFKNSVHQASANLLLYPFRYNRKAAPYLVTGLGAMIVTLSQNDLGEGVVAGLGNLKNEILYAFSAGAGVKFRLSNRFGFRIDARDYVTRGWHYGLPKSSGDPNAKVFPVSGPMHLFTGTASLVVYF